MRSLFLSALLVLPFAAPAAAACNWHAEQSASTCTEGQTWDADAQACTDVTTS